MTTSDRTQWSIVLITVAGGIIAALHVGKISPALPAILSDLGLSLVQGGFVVSMFYVLGMALALVVGVTADRLGRRCIFRPNSPSDFGGKRPPVSVQTALAFR
jgi:MFS family permease